MNNNIHHSSSVVTAKHVIGSLSRTLLAITFLFSGFVKAVDPLGTVYKIEDYFYAFGGVFSGLVDMAGVGAVLLILVEWMLGVCMLLNVRTKTTSWIALVFYLVMTPLTLWIALTNPISDCGCFGDALVLTNWQTFWKNIVLLSLVIALLVCKRAIPQTFQLWAEITIGFIAVLSGAWIMAHSLTHLPPIDFRPYKIGNNIIELMEYPEDAEADEYAITLIYEKDGQKQSFTLEDYPRGDSTWTFVDQKSVLVKKGYEPPIHDFSITTMEYDDITYEVLESEEPVTLVTMYDLHKTNRKMLPKLRSLVEQRERVYFLTGSGEEEIYAFGEELGWDEEQTARVFCVMDPVTIKTIVRANPGLITVKQGVIIEKQNLKQL